MSLYIVAAKVSGQPGAANDPSIHPAADDTSSLQSDLDSSLDGVDSKNF